MVEAALVFVLRLAVLRVPVVLALAELLLALVLRVALVLVEDVLALVLRAAVVLVDVLALALRVAVERLAVVLALAELLLVLVLRVALALVEDVLALALRAVVDLLLVPRRVAAAIDPSSSFGRYLQWSSRLAGPGTATREPHCRPSVQFAAASSRFRQLLTVRANWSNFCRPRSRRICPRVRERRSLLLPSRPATDAAEGHQPRNPALGPLVRSPARTL